MIPLQQLEAMVETIRPQLSSGHVSTYLPHLAKADVNDFAVAVYDADGVLMTSGPAQTTFTIQSVVKVFTLLLAIADWGEEKVFTHVGCDQETKVFNALDTFRVTDGVPTNPFVNSGAFAVLDLIGGSTSTKVGRVVDLVRKLADNPRVDVNMQVAHEESQRADRNRAICYYMRSNGLLDSPVEDLLDAYFQICSIEVSAEDLARAGAVLAHAERIEQVAELPRPDEVRLVCRLLHTTGMYAGAGWYSTHIAVPAKSGVSGAMLGIVPGLGGVGVYGPALDGAANSIGGIQFMGALSHVLGQ